MMVVNAVALAGGHTCRAQASEITIKRAGCAFDPGPDSAVLTGEITMVASSSPALRAGRPSVSQLRANRRGAFCFWVVRAPGRARLRGNGYPRTIRT